jgi:hypothetical protein
MQISIPARQGTNRKSASDSRLQIAELPFHEIMEDIRFGQKHGPAL